MMQKNWKQTILRAVYNYVLFFILVAFLVTCSTMLFVTVLSQTLELELTDANLNVAQS